MTTKGERTPDAELTFEAALAKLEEIVNKLEEGNQTLDDAIRLYEEGVKLHKLCEEKLSAARGKLEKVVESATGEVELQPLDEGEAEEEI